jgi:glycosyltransferase involved in cell wall biosynthesis
MPSIWWENAPLVIAEARYHRRPVICSHIGGMAEHVAHQVNGLHFQTGDAHALAAVMQQVLQDDGLWKKLRSQITAPPSMQACVAEHLALYRAGMKPAHRNEHEEVPCDG